MKFSSLLIERLFERTCLFTVIALVFVSSKTIITFSSEVQNNNNNVNNNNVYNNNVNNDNNDDINTSILSKNLVDFDTETSALNYVQNNVENISPIDVQHTMRKQWFEVSKALVLAAHKQGVDVSSTVHQEAQRQKNLLESVTALLNKGHDDIAEVTPAFQWAQSVQSIFLNIKFAFRWSSPGALNVEDADFKTMENSFEFSAIGKHSQAKKKYHLLLKPLYPIVAEKTKWNFSSVGKVVVELVKAEAGIWKTISNEKLSNVAVWVEMKGRHQADVDAYLRIHEKRFGDTEGGNKKTIEKDEKENEETIEKDEKENIETIEKDAKENKKTIEKAEKENEETIEKDEKENKDNENKEAQEMCSISTTRESCGKEDEINDGKKQEL